MKNMRKTQLRIFLLCWIAYASIYFGRVNLSVALPVLQDTFGFTKGEVGLIGTLFFCIYGFGQLINGQIGDKVSTRRFIFIGLLVVAICNVFFGLATSFVVMCILWGVNAVAQSTLWGPIVKSLSNWFAYKNRGKVAMGMSTSMVGGYLLAWSVSGAILANSKWNFVFIIPGVFILIYSFFWGTFFREHPQDLNLEAPNQSVHNSQESNQNKQYGLFEVIKMSKLWFVIIACFVQGIIKDGIALWAPSLFMETQNLNISETTQFIIFIPIMNFFGIMFAGFLNKKTKNTEKLTTAILFGVGSIMLFCFVKFSSVHVSIALLFLGLSSAMMFGANSMLLGVIPVTFAKYNRTSSIAGLLDFCSYSAAGISTFITGSIVNKVGWNGIMQIWIGCCLVGVLSLTISWYYDRIKDRKCNFV